MAELRECNAQSVLVDGLFELDGHDRAAGEVDARVQAAWQEQRNRAWVARVFTAVEDVVYVGLGLLLAGCSLALLISGLISFGQNLMAGAYRRLMCNLACSRRLTGSRRPRLVKA